jgi:dienelactone hydrolase
MRTLLLASLFTFALPITARADDKDPARVFTPPAELSDERLHVVHDVDHPVMFEPHYADTAQWEARAHGLREQVRVAAGLLPEPERTPLNAVIHGKIDREGYTIEKVFFASMPGHYVSGNLYRPTGLTGKLPAVLCPHGHWANGREYEATEDEAKKQIEIGAEKTMEGARFPLQARCAMLARMGCVVFFYDMVGYADSTPIPHRTGFTDVEAVLRLQSMMGLQSWNSIRVMDFISSLPDVDPKRIACTGASGGGTQTIMLSVLDDRLAVSFPAVMVSEEMQGGCICENSPLLRVGTNNAELISTFAPKPLGMTSADDWTAQIETMGYPQIHEIYKLYGAGDKVAAWHRSFPHNYNQVSRELMYNWMNRFLKLGQPEPVAEKPFVPVPPAELGVYDTEHPSPADFLNAVDLRKKMTAASDAQMTALAANPAEYRRVVGTALRAMVNDRLPASSDILVGDARGPKVSDGKWVIEKGTIQRRNSTWQVPYAAIMPTGWNGTVVVWVHPKGKASLFGGQGQPQAAIRKLLDGKSAVIAPDLFLTGESAGPAGRPTTGAMIYSKQTPYGAFYYGYNRGVLACRTSDVLSSIALARGWEGTKSVHLIAFGTAGLPALLADALAGDAVEHASIDLHRFSFADVKETTDDNMLPGALKYGGVWGLVPLCTSTTVLLNPPAEPVTDLVKKTTNLTVMEGEAMDDRVLGE